MKFKVGMKDPDTLHDAIKRAVDVSFETMGPLEDDEVDALAEVRREKMRDLCSRWFRYGEYLTVEIDTEAGTCTVIPCST
jgi:hypothetical protein